LLDALNIDPFKGVRRDSLGIEHQRPQDIPVDGFPVHQAHEIDDRAAASSAWAEPEFVEDNIAAISKGCAERCYVLVKVGFQPTSEPAAFGVEFQWFDIAS
jgi:hypothetical protein